MNANAVQAAPATRLVLDAETAADLMTPNPHSVRRNASVQEAAAFLIDKGFGAAPVIDESGRPVGVLSRADVLVHDRERVDYLSTATEFYERGDLATAVGEKLPEGFQVQDVDRARVQDVMTPVVFAVRPNDSARKAVDEMVALKIHRVFVVDQKNVLLGVISALDVLRSLHMES